MIRLAAFHNRRAKSALLMQLIADGYAACVQREINASQRSPMSALGLDRVKTLHRRWAALGSGRTSDVQIRSQAKAAAKRGRLEKGSAGAP
jgi:hypothetical protein